MTIKKNQCYKLIYLTFAMCADHQQAAICHAFFSMLSNTKTNRNNNKMKLASLFTNRRKSIKTNNDSAVNRVLQEIKQLDAQQQPTPMSKQPSYQQIQEYRNSDVDKIGFDTTQVEILCAEEHNVQLVRQSSTGDSKSDYSLILDDSSYALLNEKKMMLSKPMARKRTCRIYIHLIEAERFQSSIDSTPSSLQLELSVTSSNKPCKSAIVKKNDTPVYDQYMKFLCTNNTSYVFLRIQMYEEIEKLAVPFKTNSLQLLGESTVDLKELFLATPKRPVDAWFYLQSGPDKVGKVRVIVSQFDLL